MTWDQMRYPGGPYNTAACLQYLRTVGVDDRRVQVHIIEKLRSVHGDVIKAVMVKVNRDF